MIPLPVKFVYTELDGLYYLQDKIIEDEINMGEISNYITDRLTLPIEEYI